MATKKKTETRTKAAVGRERRLALALRALLDSLETFDVGENNPLDVVESLRAEGQSAKQLLTDLGYDDLEGIPTRVARLNESLKQAVEAGDGKLIAQLGNELDRAQQGLPPSKAKVTGKSRRTATPSTSLASSAVDLSSSGN